MPINSQYACVDLGSNSFHMLVAREERGQLKIIDRIQENVRLAAGLDPNNRLTAVAIEQAIKCLARFGQRIRSIQPDHIRAVGTNTLRKAHNSRHFIRRAEAALGHRIEVIAGREEARLIYLGVAHAQTPGRGRQLVVDIGGGSTELIIGEGFNSIERESLFMGCVQSSQQYFADGKIKKSAFERAVTHARLELQPIAHRFIALAPNKVIGSSGTARAVASICEKMGWSDYGIDARALQALRSHMLEAKRVEALDLKGLNENRRAVICGGVAILIAVFNALRIERMTASTGALREGLLHDLIGRTHEEDIRPTAIADLQRRYGVDRGHARKIADTAQYIFTQVAETWQLSADEDRNCLQWGALVHEIGAAISHIKYHKHGAYLLTHSDLPGFSKYEQERLALLVGAHRRKLNMLEFDVLPEEQQQRTLYLAVIVRLAVLIHRGHHAEPAPPMQISARSWQLQVNFPDSWLREHPLTAADLQEEQDLLSACGVDLSFA